MPSPEQPLDRNPPHSATGEEEEKSAQIPEEYTFEPVSEKAAKQNRQRILAEQQSFLRVNGQYINTAQFDNLFMFQGESVYHSKLSEQRVRRIALVDEEEIRRISAVYERPEQYDQARDYFHENHTVILQGQPHIGKRAMAIHLAVSVFGRDLTMHALSTEIDLRQITGESLKEDCAYLVDGLIASRAQNLKQFDWEQLRTELRKKNSYLVICVWPGVRFASDFPKTAIYSISAPPHSRKIVEKHLRFEGVNEDAIKSCLAKKEVKTLLERPMLPPEARELARCLIPYINEEKELVKALQEISAYTTTAVEEWFDACNDNMSERAFRIALAVFNGARYTAVQEASRHLAQRLKSDAPPKKEDDPPPTKSPFGRKKSTYLDQVHAYTTTEYILAEYSDRSPVEVIKLKDEKYQPVFLRYLWEEYPDFRKDFLEWLAYYGGYPLADIRSRAAGAVGFLAQLDFATIRTEILYRWARAAFNEENGWRYRTALSEALGNLIWDDNRVDDVLGLLRYWIQQNDVALVWAAVRAYVLVGIRYPREAMEQWQYTFMRIVVELGLTDSLKVHYDRKEQKRLFDMARLLDSLIDAIFRFFLAPLTWPPERFQRVYEQILTSLREWVDGENHVFVDLIGLPYFLLLMDLTIMSDNKSGQENDEMKHPPALLVLANGCELGDTCLDDLAWLLSKCLRTRQVRQETLNILQQWLYYADSEQTLQSALERVLKTLLTTPNFNRSRWHGLLKTRLRRWQNLPKHPIPLAGELITKLQLDDGG